MQITKIVPRWDDTVTVTVLDVGSCVWYLAKDVTNSLKYLNARKAIFDHVSQINKINLAQLCEQYEIDYQKISNKILQAASCFLNESGVWELISKSSLPKARKYRLTHGYLGAVTKDEHESLCKELHTEREQRKLAQREVEIVVSLCKKVIIESSELAKKLEESFSESFGILLDHTKRVERGMVTNAKALSAARMALAHQSHQVANVSERPELTCVVKLFQNSAEPTLYRFLRVQKRSLDAAMARMEPDKWTELGTWDVVHGVNTINVLKESIRVDKTMPGNLFVSEDDVADKLGEIIPRKQDVETVDVDCRRMVAEAESLVMAECEKLGLVDLVKHHFAVNQLVLDTFLGEMKHRMDGFAAGSETQRAQGMSGGVKRKLEESQ